MRRIVVGAAAEGLTVRPAGAGHSFTPVVATDGVLLDLAGLGGGVRVDGERSTVTVRGGTRIAELGDPLWEAGLTLVNMGDIDTQAVAGAVATGTHGTGVTLPSMSASLRAARLVTASGDVVEVTESDGDLLRAARVAIGLLGVMTELTLDVAAGLRPARAPLVRRARGADRLLRRAAARTPPLLVLLLPVGALGCALRGSDNRAGSGNVEARRRLLAEADGRAARRGGAAAPGLGERVDRMYRICPSVFEPNFHEMEYMLPVTRGKEALLELRELLRTTRRDAIYPVECRFTAGDDGFLSPFAGRETAVISVSGEPGTDYWPFLRDCDSIFRNHDGRPHWGKIHFMSRERLDEQFPEAERFREIRRDARSGGRVPERAPGRALRLAPEAPPGARSREARGRIV